MKPPLQSLPPRENRRSHQATFPKRSASEQLRVDSLVFDKGLQQPLQFNTGPMDDVMAVLQTCTNDLLGRWGIDAERHAALLHGPMPLEGPLIGRSILPFDQFAKLTGGYNQVRVMVSATGDATSCHIHFPTLDEGVNEQICEQVLENARFDPARDADGETVDSYWLVPVLALLGPPPE